VVVPDASMTSDARKVMCEELKAVGFGEVIMLNKPVVLPDAAEAAPRVVAA
jgi:succinoglycan biosynthesis transport protein ExoP